MSFIYLKKFILLKILVFFSDFNEEVLEYIEGRNQQLKVCLATTIERIKFFDSSTTMGMANIGEYMGRISYLMEEVEALEKGKIIIQEFKSKYFEFDDRNEFMEKYFLVLEKIYGYNEEIMKLDGGVNDLKKIHYLNELAFGRIEGQIDPKNIWNINEEKACFIKFFFISRN